MARRLLTPAERAEILRLYYLGRKVVEIGDQCNVHWSYPSKLAAREGTGVRSRPQPAGAA